MCIRDRFLSLQLCDECGYIGITLIRVACGGKQFPYKNYILESDVYKRQGLLCWMIEDMSKREMYGQQNDFFLK